MTQPRPILFILILSLILSGNVLLADSGPAAGPSKVELRKTGETYRLYVNGQEFYVKGAGCEFGDISTLKAHGANSFRTWRINNGKKTGIEILDEAHKYGLKVLMGIDVARERHGFDYNDTAAVATQLKKILADVKELKDHPALLGWGIGNELNLHYTNKKVWDAVNEISDEIHKIDGNHPTTTMLAGIGKEEVDYIRDHCQSLDFISIQMYGDIINLAQRISDAGYQGPYMVTEWGATGHWEMPATEWKAPIEQTSSEKAESIQTRYKEVILKDSTHCLGSYVFLWEQKQERTPTWYGLFTDQYEETEAIDVMHYFWNGQWPSNRATKISGTRLDGKDRFENIRLKAGQTYEVTLEVDDPDGDVLSSRIEIMHESQDLGEGGDHESRPGSIEALVLKNEVDRISFKAMEEPGAYRFFIYVLDGHNHAATVNFPFYIDE